MQEDVDTSNCLSQYEEHSVVVAAVAAVVEVVVFDIALVADSVVCTVAGLKIHTVVVAGSETDIPDAESRTRVVDLEYGFGTDWRLAVAAAAVMMVVAGLKIGIETWVGKAAVSVAVVVLAAAGGGVVVDLHGNFHCLGMYVQVGPSCSPVDSVDSGQQDWWYSCHRPSGCIAPC